MKKPKKQSNIVPLSGTAYLTQKMHNQEEKRERFDIRGFLIGLSIAKQITGSNTLDELFEAVKAHSNEGVMTKSKLQEIILEGGK